MELKVNIKKMGKKKSAVETVSFSLPQKPDTVKMLLETVCRQCVRSYNQSLEAPELLKVMTREELEDRASSGKVGFGRIYSGQKAGEAQAVEEVFQSFEDGIFRVFLDDKPLERLEETIEITDDSRVTFVRLAMLAGRMW